MPEIIVKLGDTVVNNYFMEKDVVSIGRAPDNEIAIENLAISRRHAVIRRIDGRYVIEDDNSANGTYVNGVRITKTEIVDADVIAVGKHKLYFHILQKPRAAPPADAAAYAQATMVVSSIPTVTPTLRVLEGKQNGEVFQLTKVETRIGRASDNDIRLNDWFVSKRHAKIIRKGMVYVIQDLASWRHTLVNGENVEERVLQPGDQIQFGPKIKVVFEIKEGAEITEGSGRSPVELADAPAETSGTPGAVAAEGQGLAKSSSAGVNWVEDADSVVMAEPEAPAGKEIEAAPSGAEASIDSSEKPIPAAGPALAEQQEPAPESAQDVGDPQEPALQDESETVKAEPPSLTVESPMETEETAQEPGLEREESPQPESETPADEAPSLDEAQVDEEPGEVEAASEASGETSDDASEDAGAEGEESSEVTMWLEALKNPSKIIRKQAQRRLKDLTGRDYDIE
ncbi:FHA domain-containing protein [Candidatus Sumerlaeota bacterium]|nr:FHA domain-containing protein [Candidatus Sumerlaeota bacterium]